MRLSSFSIISIKGWNFLNGFIWDVIRLPNYDRIIQRFKKSTHDTINYLIEKYQQIKGEYLILTQMKDHQGSYEKLAWFSSYGKPFQAQEWIEESLQSFFLKNTLVKLKVMQSPNDLSKFIELKHSSNKAKPRMKTQKLYSGNRKIYPRQRHQNVAA